MEHVNNNLSLCLAAIAGKVDPNAVKYHNGLEYQLLKIAGMTEESSGGDDTPSENRYTAKKVLTFKPNQEMGKTAYMVTVDLGIESMPYDVFGLTVDVDGTGYNKNRIWSKELIVRTTPFSGDTINFSEKDLKDGDRLSPVGLYATNYILAYFTKESENANNFKLQMFIYDDASVNENAPAEKEMTINVTLVEAAGEDDGK